MNRRDLLKMLAGGAAIAATAGGGARSPAWAQAKPFNLPPLGYGYEALEPHIDTATMRIHHSAHHQAYVNNINAIAEKWPELGQKSIDEVLSNLTVVPDAHRTGVRNNLGGHWNHAFFWDLMTPGGAKAPTEAVKAAIDSAFGDFDKMKASVKQAGMTRFGSGWAFLTADKDKKLTVLSTANQDTPHMVGGGKAILAIDVWEHAYYLKHQQKRTDYIDVWWSTVNWDKVATNFAKATA